MKHLLFAFCLLSACFAIAQTPLLVENFDAATLPSNWTVIDNDGLTVDTAVSEYTAAWIAVADPNDATNGCASSTSYFDPAGRADRWLISPQITLGASSNYISWQTMSFDPSFPDSYKVLISTTGNTIADFTDTLVVVSNATPYWFKHTENLDEYASQNIYIAFVNTTYDGFKLFMDSVNIRKDDPLSVAKENIKLSVYPNPIVDLLNIEATSSQILKVELKNTIGEVVLSKRISLAKNSITLSVANLPKGVYFLSVQTSKGVVERKLVK